MDLKKDVDNNHHEENDGNSRDCLGDSSNNENNNNIHAVPVRNVRQFLRRVIDSMNNAQDANANPMLTAPPADSPLHILNALCNELLYEIFMQLDFLDLLNVAKVCVRFQGQAHAAFASKYKYLMLSHDDECDQKKMESILCEFGLSIRSLHIVSNNDSTADSALFRSIIQNCTTELTVLNLFNITVQVESPDFRLPFPKLQELRLFDCEGNISLAHLVDDCPELKIIAVTSENLKGVNGLIDRKFEKLERIYLSDYDGDIYDDVLERFVTLNPQLVDLFVRAFSNLNTSHALRLIGQNLLKLKVLHFLMHIADWEQSDIECLGRLRSLKCLWLDFNGLNVTPLARALVKSEPPIRNLNIYRGSIDEIAIQCISQLKSLEYMSMDIVDYLNDEQLIGLARNLPKLKELRVLCLTNSLTINGLTQMIRHAKKLDTFKVTKVFNSTEFIISTDDYNTMVDIVRKRPGKIAVFMEIFGQNVKLNVPEAILVESHSILSIRCVSILSDTNEPW